MRRREWGFTLVEVILAALLLSVGLLGLASSAALVMRMLERGRRSAAAALFAGRRLEMLRARGCASQAPGAEVANRDGTPVDSVTWRFAALGSGAWHIVVTNHYRTDITAWRTDSIETEISCAL
jgi:Tfp pilus assembly protein PilV